MKLAPIIIIAVLAGCIVPAAPAQVIVEDVAHIAQDAANQVVNAAKYVQMISNQVQQINTMTQQLEQVTAYVKAFGDPSKLVNITGVSPLVTDLQKLGVGQPLTTIQQTASGVQSLTNNGGGLYQTITNTSASGTAVQRVANLYKPFAAVESAASNFVAVYNDVMQRRQTLKGQISGTISQLQSASTAAETQKLHGVLTAQGAQLQALDQELTHAASQAVIQDIGNRNNDAKQRQAQNEALAADRQDALTKFGTMMAPDVNSDLRFGGGSQ